MEVNDQQLKAVSALAGPKRYEHFIKVVVDCEEAWGLFSDGWALSETDSGEPIFPIWPARRYAEVCAQDQWDGYDPESIPLEHLINELLPMLKEDGVLPGVFLTPEGKGVTPEIDLLLGDLQTEIENYE